MKTLAQIYYDLNKEARIADKADYHPFFRSHIDLYEELLAPYRHTTEHIVEIGVRRGGSLRMWAEYFPNAQVYGLDIKEIWLKSMRGAYDRITVCGVDQSSREELQTFINEHGRNGFDIAIDDGSHLWADQIISFRTFWPHIKDGGLYVIEDTLNSYYSKVGNTGQTAVNYFMALVNDINFYGKDDISQPTEIQDSVGWIGFRYNAVFLKKQIVRSNKP